MEISSIFLSSSFSRPSSPLPFSSSNSLFFRPNSFVSSKTISCSSVALNKTRTQRAKKGFSCTCLFGLGVPELVVIGGVAALLFGPKNLPGVGKTIGKTIKSFQQAAKEFESELKKEPDSQSDSSSEEKPTAISEDKKEEVNVSSAKDSL